MQLTTRLHINLKINILANKNTTFNSWQIGIEICCSGRRSGERGEPDLRRVQPRRRHHQARLRDDREERRAERLQPRRRVQAAVGATLGPADDRTRTGEAEVHQDLESEDRTRFLSLPSIKVNLLSLLPFLFHLRCFVLERINWSLQQFV